VPRTRVPVAFAAPEVRPVALLVTAVVSRPGELAIVGTGGLARVQVDAGSLAVAQQDEGFSMTAVTVLDANGDGRADYAFATAGGVRLRLAEADGDYVPPTEKDVALAVSARWLVAGDFDGDGHDDVVAVTESAHTPLWGDGAELDKGDAAAGTIAHVIAGDLDHDGRDELVLASGQDVRIVRYDALRARLDDVVSTHAAGEISALGLADLDGDGGGDLLVGVRDGAGLDVVMAPLAALPSVRSVTLPVAPVALAAGDLDGDGDQDLLALLAEGQGLLRLEAQADGHGARERIAVGADPIGLSTADLDGDGAPEVVVVGRRQVTRVARDGGVLRGAVVDAAFAPVACDSVAVGDVDGDGHPDLIASQAGAVTARVAGGGVVEIATGADPRWVALADVDGDHADDVVTVGPEGVTFLAQSLAETRSVASPLLEPSSIDVGDLDGDGRAEAVVTDREGGRVVVFPFDGAPRSIDVPGAPVAVRLGDLDEDGEPELIVSRRASDRIAVFSAAGESRLELSVAVPGLLTVGDLDGDGHLDVAVVTGELGQVVTVFHGDGHGSLERSEATESLPAPAGAIASPDLDGDGRHDLVVLIPSLGAALLVRHDPVLDLVTHALYATLPDARAFAVGDHDEDGLPDLLLAGRGLSLLQGQALP
jgi:FG-GAP-like repeat